MSTSKEQLDPKSQSANWRKSAKRQMNKLQRRLAKADPQSAPKTKKYRGYET